VGDVRHNSIISDVRPEIYLPLAQLPQLSMVLVVRTVGDPHQAARKMRAAVRLADREQPLFRIETIEERIEQSLAGPRATAQMLGFLAALALLLAAVGIYGVLSYTAGARAREIGVRLAVGARRADVFGLVLRQGVLLALAGMAAGLAGAFALAPLMGHILDGVTPYDPMTFGVAAGTLSLAALAACALPAWRAMRVDPIRVLREE
jgi:putative ABC transport system permease protein